MLLCPIEPALNFYARKSNALKCAARANNTPLFYSAMVDIDEIKLHRPSTLRQCNTCTSILVQTRAK